MKCVNFFSQKLSRTAIGQTRASRHVPLATAVLPEQIMIHSVPSISIPDRSKRLTRFQRIASVNKTRPSVSLLSLFERTLKL